MQVSAIWLEAITDNLKKRRAMREEIERFILWGLHARGNEPTQLGGDGYPRLYEIYG